jgi:Protein of unknown function (DUF2803).
MASTVRTISQIILSKLAWIPLLLLSVSSQAWANDKVYQVEFIVFERRGGSLGIDDESWQKNAQLDYPTRWRRLVDPNEVPMTQEPEIPSDEFLQTLAQESGQSPAAATQPSSDTSSEYFVYLPAQQRNLKNTRDALARRYRILFHETWLQPMEPVEKATPLILHGGNRYGDHFELQGTLTLGVSRFLHVQTDLWLSEFTTNSYQESPYGVQLPLEPQEQAEVAPSETLDSETPELYEYEEVTEPTYLVNQVITLQQKRRMRSGELHYLDHPRLAALIKITPR